MGGFPKWRFDTSKAAHPHDEPAMESALATVKETLMPYIIIACRALFGGVFMVAALSKILRPGAFRSFTRSAASLMPLPAAFRVPSAVAIVFAEFGVPLLMLTPSTVPWGFDIAALALAAFAAALARGLRRGTAGRCHCFGASPTPATWWHVAADVVLAAVALAVSALVVFGHAGSGSTHPAGTLVAILTGALAAGLVVVMDDLVHVFTAMPGGRMPSRPDTNAAGGL